MSGAALVARDDRPDGARLQGVEKRQVVNPGDPEHGPDPCRLEYLDYRLRRRLHNPEPIRRADLY
jgi:hypothetical protein